MKKQTAILRCECGATAKDNSTERGRFKRRHPALCQSHTQLLDRAAKKFMPSGVRSTEPTTFEEHREAAKDV